MKDFYGAQRNLVQFGLKNTMKKTLFTLLFCCVFIGFSQEKILLKGQLVFSSMNTSAINIVNTATHFGTINNANGEFEIEVGLGDVLLFSSVQYEPQRLIITKEIMEKRWVRVPLRVEVNKLDAVTISNNALTGRLHTDVKAVGLEKFYNNASFGIPMAAPRLTVEERRLYTATTGNGTIPLDPIINAISGRTKKLKKLKAFSELDQLIEKALKSMGTEFFVAQCGIPEIYIGSFMYFCSEDNRFKRVVNQNKKLVLVDFFKEKAIGFRRSRNREENN